MLSQRAATITRMNAAFNARDLDGWMRDSIESLEIESRFSAVGGMRYHGRDGVVAWWADLAEAWDPLVLRLDGTADVSADVTVVLATIQGTGRESGVALDEPVALRWLWRRERLRRIEYMDRQEAELIVGAAA